MSFFIESPGFSQKRRRKRCKKGEIWTAKRVNALLKAGQLSKKFRVKFKVKRGFPLTVQCEILGFCVIDPQNIDKNLIRKMFLQMSHCHHSQTRTFIGGNGPNDDDDDDYDMSIPRKRKSKFDPLVKQPPSKKQKTDDDPEKKTVVYFVFDKNITIVKNWEWYLDILPQQFLKWNRKPNKIKSVEEIDKYFDCFLHTRTWKTDMTEDFLSHLTKIKQIHAWEKKRLDRCKISEIYEIDVTNPGMSIMRIVTPLTYTLDEIPTGGELDPSTAFKKIEKVVDMNNADNFFAINNAVINKQLNLLSDLGVCENFTYMYYACLGKDKTSDNKWMDELSVFTWNEMSKDRIKDAVRKCNIVKVAIDCVFIQTLYALHCAYEWFGFEHLDLHRNNVMARPIEPDQKGTYFQFTVDLIFFLPREYCPFMVEFIDFDFGKTNLKKVFADAGNLKVDIDNFDNFVTLHRNLLPRPQNPTEDEMKKHMMKIYTWSSENEYIALLKEVNPEDVPIPPFNSQNAKSVIRDALLNVNDDMFTMIANFHREIFVTKIASDNLVALAKFVFSHYKRGETLPKPPNTYKELGKDQAFYEGLAEAFFGKTYFRFYGKIPDDAKYVYKFQYPWPGHLRTTKI